MNARYSNYIYISIAIIFVIFICFAFFSKIYYPHKGSGNKSLRMIPEESFFVDYDIVNENTVKFRYSICFANDSEIDTNVSIQATFNSDELKGWVKKEHLFIGMDNNGKMLSETVKHGEKVNIVFVFEGEYLGGSVNENLSFPSEYMLGLSYSN